MEGKFGGENKDSSKKSAAHVAGFDPISAIITPNVIALNMSVKRQIVTRVDQKSP